MIKNFVAASVAVALASSAWAHEGHGVPGQGDTVAHYATDPLHLPLLIGLCVATIGIAVVTRKYLREKCRVARR